MSAIGPPNQMCCSCILHQTILGLFGAFFWYKSLAVLRTFGSKVSCSHNNSCWQSRGRNRGELQLQIYENRCSVFVVNRRRHPTTYYHENITQVRGLRHWHSVFYAIIYKDMSGTFIKPRNVWLYRKEVIIVSLYISTLFRQYGSFSLCIYILVLCCLAAQYKNIQSIENTKNTIIHRQKIAMLVMGINKRNKQMRVHHS